MTALVEDAWGNEPVGFFQHLLREVDAETVDPAALIAEAKAAGAGAYITMGGGFSAWYPTKLPSQRVNPHLKGDFLGEVIAAAKAAGVRTIVRMDISKGRPEWLEAHPEWFVRRADGVPGLVWEMPQICATGSFWQVENFAILSELTERYRFDGLFYNYFNVARCYCERCREIVRSATGADVPQPGTRSPAYERWRQRYMADYVGAVGAFVHKRLPDAVLIPYHHVRDGWNYRAMAEAADLVSAQISNPLAVNPVDPQPQWNHWAAEEALVARAMKPRKAPVLIQTGSEFFASRQTAMPPARLLRNLIQAAAHGAEGAPSLNGTMQQDDPRAVPALLAFGRYRVRNARWYEGLSSKARIALVRSQDSMDWGPDAGRPAGHSGRPGHVAEFRGLYEAIVGLRYPCDIVPGGGLKAEDLARYAVVILPAVSCLSGADAEVLDAYVAGGGTIVATADLGACDEDGVPRSSPALKAIPHLPGPARPIFGAYFEIADPTLRANLGGIPHIGADGDFWTPAGTNPPDGMEGDLRLIGPFRNNAPEFTVVRGPGAEPGLLAASSAPGATVWLPWRIGALYHAFGIPEYATLLGHVLRRFVGEPAIRTDAPAAVEAIFYDHPKGEVLHLLNNAAVQGGPLVETAALAGFTLRIRSRAGSATRLDTGASLPVERDDDDCIIRLDRLDTFVAIALTEGDSAP